MSPAPPTPAPLRVALVIPELQIGGTERQVVLLATGLARAGHTVSVVSLFGLGPLAVDLQRAGIRVVGPLGTRSATGAVAAIWRLARLLRQERPQALHAFLLAATAIAGPAAVAARVPARVAGRRSLGDWKDGRHVVGLVERVTSRCYAAFVANASAVAADAVGREGLRPGTVHVIPNALPTGPAAPPEGPLDRPDEAVGHPTVLCVANLIDYKGHRDLIAAQRILRDRGVRFGLLLAGEGPERPELERLVRADDLPTKLLGTRSDVSALLTVADVVALPSWHEGASNALMEAMAAGRAIIATDVGGNAEVLGGTGLLCAPRRPEQLADALGTLLIDEALRARLAAATRERAAVAFSQEALVRQHVELYASLLRRHG